MSPIDPPPSFTSSAMPPRDPPGHPRRSGDGAAETRTWNRGFRAGGLVGFLVGVVATVIVLAVAKCPPEPVPVDGVSPTAPKEVGVP